MRIYQLVNYLRINERIKSCYIKRSGICMKLIVGLGNPGKKFEHTRHNVGFMVVDVLAEDLNTDVNQNKFQSLVGQAGLNGVNILLAKPQTYMNLSGQAVAEIMRWYKISVEDLLVIYDDMDLPVGRMRLKTSGSAGGHNGVKSIIEHLSAQDFNRLRIGIGKARTKDVNSHVLGEFTKEELKVIHKVIGHSKNAVELFVCDGITTAMNQYNGLIIE